MGVRLHNEHKINVTTFQTALHNHNRRHAHVNVDARTRKVRKSTRKIPPVSHWCSYNLNSKTTTQRGGDQHRHSPESTTPSPSTTCARKSGRASSRSTKTDPQDTSSVTWVGDNLHDQTASHRGRAQHRHVTKSSKHPPPTTYTRKCRRAASRSTKTDPQDTSIVR